MNEALEHTKPFQPSGTAIHYWQKRHLVNNNIAKSFHLYQHFTPLIEPKVKIHRFLLHVKRHFVGLWRLPNPAKNIGQGAIFLCQPWNLTRILQPNCEKGFSNESKRILR
jgi:hypothetical protein